MNQKLPAQLISIISLPVFVFPAAILLLVLGRSLSDLASAIVFIVVGGTPMFLVQALDYVRHSRTNTDLNQKQRDYVYLAGVIGFAIASVIFGSQLREAINWYNLSLVTAILWGAFFVVNRYFDKLSAHIGVFVFAVTLLAGKANMAYSFALVFIPILIWARLQLHKHEWIEIWWGLAVGLAIGLLSWLI
jgi:hypothetical protein